MKPVAYLTLYALAACSPVEVDWSNLHPSVKERIDRMAAEGDCAGLQREFDIMYENDDAQRARTGRGNSGPMGYVLDKRSAIGCD